MVVARRLDPMKKEHNNSRQNRYKAVLDWQQMTAQIFEETTEENDCSEYQESTKSVLVMRFSIR